MLHYVIIAVLFAANPLISMVPSLTGPAPQQQEQQAPVDQPTEPKKRKRDLYENNSGLDRFVQSPSFRGLYRSAATIVNRSRFVNHEDGETIYNHARADFYNQLHGLPSASSRTTTATTVSQRQTTFITDASSSESEQSDVDFDQQQADTSIKLLLDKSSARADSDNNGQQAPQQPQPEVQTAPSFIDAVSNYFPFNIKPAQDATDVSSSESEQSESENDQQQVYISTGYDMESDNEVLLQAAENITTRLMPAPSFFSTLHNYIFNVENKKAEVVAQLNTLSLIVPLALGDLNYISYRIRIIAQIYQLNSALKIKQISYFTMKRILALVTLANQQMQLGTENKDLVLTNLQCALDELTLLENK